MVGKVASIIIPVGHYHRDIADRAHQSAIQQTVPCDVLVVHDTDRRGAGWARNQGIAQAKTPFVVFLDADDVLHPTFVERTVQHWLDGERTRYVYTDWRLPDGRVRYAEECFSFFDTGMAHIITTLLPTATVYAIGGFDETIGGAGEEDEDFYARLHVAGLCHSRVAEPLVDYHIDQGKSITNAETNPDYDAAVAAIEQRFNRKFGKYRGTSMADCAKCGGGSSPQGSVPLNEQFPGSVLAFALYTPARMTGPKSGIGYKRAGLGQQLYVHEADITARPDLWERVPTVEQLTPTREDVLSASGLVG